MFAPSNRVAEPAAGAVVVLLLFLAGGGRRSRSCRRLVFRRDAGFRLSDGVVDDGLNLLEDALGILLRKAGDQPVEDALGVGGQIGRTERSVELFRLRPGERAVGDQRENEPLDIKRHFSSLS